MSYHEEKRVRLRRQVSKQAIASAIEGNWQESIALNKQIIESFPNDVEAYNRLGKAYLELGEYAQAKEAYTQALQLDRYNLIATKNLQRLTRLGEGKAEVKSSSDKADPQLFLEETGKAAVVSLYQVAPPDVLVKVVAGDRAHLEVKDSSLAIENATGEVLGLVPAKYAQRLIKLMKKGNKYAGAIVSVSENTLSVIIREMYQSPSLVGQASFPSRRIEELPSYVGDHLLRHEIEEEEAGEEEFAEEEETSGFSGDIEDKGTNWEQEA